MMLRRPGSTYRFGPFELDGGLRQLTTQGASVSVGGRALDLLLAFVERPGQVLGKDELLAKVWPGLQADEASLRVQIAALRKCLGDGRMGARYIATLPGRGYCFVAVVARGPDQAAATSVDGAGPPGAAAPARVDVLFGREANLADVLALQQRHRLLTLTGPGGIGKTRLARAAASALSPGFAADVCVVELGVLNDPDLVLRAVAASLGLQQLPLHFTLGDVADLVRERRCLLLLDNCEHLLGPVIDVLDTLLQRTRGLEIIVTSQEPTRAFGERVYRVPPLRIQDGPGLGASAAGDTGAIDLFIARATQADAAFLPDVTDLQLIPHICRRLEGIPLAIELAASRAVLLGVQGVAAGLDRRFQMLRGGRRTAHPRQQTMRAALDWSFSLLSGRDREVMGALGTFMGSFPLEAAEAIAPDASDKGDVALCIAGLVERSIINLEFGPAGARYRVPETVRAYVQEEFPAEPSRLHVQFYTCRMAQAAAEWRTMPAAAWLARYGPDLENVRAAMQWSLVSAATDEDTARLGATLTADAILLWIEASLYSEAEQWARRALAVALPTSAETMMLTTALGTILLSTSGAHEAIAAMFRRARDLAEILDQPEYLLRSLYGLWVHALHQNEYRDAYSIAGQFFSVASGLGDAGDIQVGDRLVGTTEHYLGRQDAARSRLVSWLDRPSKERLSREARFGVDQHVAALTILARVLALQAEPDRALQVVQQAVEAAHDLARAVSICHALGEQCVVALWTNAVEVLATTAAALEETTSRHALRFWRPHVLVARAVLARHEGDGPNAAALILEAVREVGADRFDIVYPSLVTEIANGLAEQQPEAARTLVDQALGRAHGLDRWYTPALLLARGRLTLREGGDRAAEAAMADFCTARNQAESQSAWLLHAQSDAATEEWTLMQQELHPPAVTE